MRGMKTDDDNTIVDLTSSYLILPYLTRVAPFCACGGQVADGGAAPCRKGCLCGDLWVPLCHPRLGEPRGQEGGCLLLLHRRHLARRVPAQRIRRNENPFPRETRYRRVGRNGQAGNQGGQGRRLKCEEYTRVRTIQAGFSEGHRSSSLSLHH